MDATTEKPADDDSDREGAPGPTAAGDVILATDGHPFWVPELGQWVDAIDLAPGMWLQTSAGTWVQVTAIRAWTQAATAHNLTVQGTHTYHVGVGNEDILVHNCGPDIPWSSSLASRAPKAIDEGARDIYVAYRSQAEELFLGKFQEAGYVNTTGFSASGVRQFFNSKVGTYYWDDIIGLDGRVVGHGVGNAHGNLPHLQIHTFEGPIIRIF